MMARSPVPCRWELDAMAAEYAARAAERARDAVRWELEAAERAYRHATTSEEEGEAADRYVLAVTE